MVISDTALVFEGGGMRASYTSGLVTALLEEGIRFPWVGGISAGASLTCNFVSQDIWRTRHSFTDFVGDPQFGNWRTFVRGKGLFNSHFIYEEAGLPGGALEFDWDTFSSDPAQVCFGTFEATTGRTVYWRRDALPTFDAFATRVRASSSLPIVMPPVHLDGEVYVDGGIGDNAGIPLPAARQDGYRRFLIVLTQERGYRKRPTGNDWFYRNHFRKYPAIAEAIRKRPARYNALREEIFELERSGQAYVFVPDRMTFGNSERNLAKLRAAYDDGLAQARRELPAIKEFLAN